MMLPGAASDVEKWDRYRRVREVSDLPHSDPSIEDEPIQLAPPDPSWPARFEQERVLLEEAIGEWISGGIHHVGSTAVPGMEAKPIIDILVGVDSLRGSLVCFEPLAKLEYL